MRLKLTFLLCLSSFMASARLFVNKETPLSFTTPETILNFQEFLNQIDANIYGKGLLYLRSTSQQQLAFTQTDLELPSLFVQNRSWQSVLTPLMYHALTFREGHDVFIQTKA